MDKIIAVKNFVVFAVPLSVLLVCKIVLPVSMYNSIVDYTADNFFMPPQDNRGLCTMYKTSLTPKTFLLWTTSNVEAIKSSFSSLLLELGCKAHVGNTIDEEIEFIEYHSLQPVKLSQFNIPIEEQTPMMAIDQSKPIVINIGSASGPPFRHEMKHFNSCVVEKYKDAFVYIVLYINEAHPSNGWFIGDGVYAIANHTCIQDRKTAAQYLDDDLHPDVHVLLDNVKNQGQKVFGTKYERLYVLQQGRVLYQGGNGPFGYNLDDLDDFLKVLTTPN